MARSRKPADASASGGRKDAVVLFTHASWMDGGERQGAAKGEKVSLPASEFARLEVLGAVAAPRSKDAKAAEADAPADDAAGEG